MDRPLGGFKPVETQKPSRANHRHAIWVLGQDPGGLPLLEDIWEFPTIGGPNIVL